MRFSSYYSTSGVWYAVAGQSHDRVLSPAALFDVRHDLGEMKDVVADHPAIVERLLALAEKAQ